MSLSRWATHRDVRGGTKKINLSSPHWEKKERGSGSTMRCSSGIKENALKLLGILSWWRAKLKRKTYGLRNTEDKLMSEKEEIMNLSTVLWGQADSSLKSLAKRWFLFRKPVASEWSIHTGISAKDWGQRAGISLFQTLRNKSRRVLCIDITCSLSRHGQWLPGSCSWALDLLPTCFVCTNSFLLVWQTQVQKSQGNQLCHWVGSLSSVLASIWRMLWLNFAIIHILDTIEDIHLRAQWSSWLPEKTSEYFSKNWELHRKRAEHHLLKCLLSVT